MTGRNISLHIHPPTWPEVMSKVKSLKCETYKYTCPSCRYNVPQRHPMTFLLLCPQILILPICLCNMHTETYSQNNISQTIHQEIQTGRFHERKTPLRLMEVKCLLLVSRNCFLDAIGQVLFSWQHILPFPIELLEIKSCPVNS